jgi:hypothetical protein
MVGKLDGDSGRGWDVFGGEGGAGAEEEFLHLFNEEFLGLRGPGLEAVFVEQHFLALEPLLPAFAGDGVKDFCAEVGVEGRFVEAFHLLLVAAIHDHVRHNCSFGRMG